MKNLALCLYSVSVPCTQSSYYTHTLYCLSSTATAPKQLPCCRLETVSPQTSSSDLLHRLRTFPFHFVSLTNPPSGEQGIRFWVPFTDFANKLIHKNGKMTELWELIAGSNFDFQSRSFAPILLFKVSHLEKKKIPFVHGLIMGLIVLAAKGQRPFRRW